MLSFHTKYHPLTSRPYLANNTYIEYQACELLRPYIACYWVTDGMKNTNPTDKSEVLVVPDTCLDIIVRINHTRQTIDGFLSGIQDVPFISTQQEDRDMITCFAIRFHFWAVHLFLNINLHDSHNRSVALQALGREWELLFEPFLYLISSKDRIEYVDSFLLKKINGIEINTNLFNTIGRILTVPGQATVKDLCEYSCISQRQMERVFLQKVGLPLKRICSLVRYQKVWHDMAMTDTFDIQDAVYRYGYTDQAHLLKEFKRFHGVTPKEARRIAALNR